MPGLRFDKVCAGAIIAVVLLSFITEKKAIPELGIVASLDQDSVIYSAGFRMLGASVGKTLSPLLTEDQFQQNLARIKKARNKVYMCNVFFPGNIKIAGPHVDM